MVKDESGSEGTTVPLRMIKLVKQAHQEAKEREAKEKSKRMTLYKGTLEDEDLGDEEPHVEPARISLTLKITDEATFGLESLIDPGASHNFISFEAWQTLSKGSMVPTNATVTTINGTRTRPIGYVTMDVIIAKHVLQVRFYVMPVGTMEEHVILGRTWCYLTNCQIDWHKKQAKMVYKGNATQVPLLQEDTSTQPSMPTNGASTNNNDKGKQVLIPNTTLSKPPQSPHSTPTTSTTQPPRTQPLQESMPCSHPTTTSLMTRWIPKGLLQAQGYFQGEKDVWLPRQPRHQKPTSPSQSKPQQRKAKRAQCQRRTHQ